MKDFLNQIEDYQKEILAILVLVVAIAGGAYYYHYSRIQREKKACTALSETLYEFEKALRNQTTWQEVDLAAHTGFRQHKNSSLGLYFLFIQAEAMFHKGEVDKSIEIIDMILHEMPTYLPLYYPLKLKYVRMLIDSKDQSIVENGLKELEKLSNDNTESNTVQDAALYYLGNYYAIHGEINRAKDIWQSLVQRFPNKKEEISPWAKLAQVQLQ